MKKRKKVLYVLLTIVFSNFVTSVNALNIYNKKNAFYELGLKETAIALNLEESIKKYYNNKYPNYFGGIHLSDDASTVILKIVKENIPNELS